MKRSPDFRLQYVGGQALLVPLGARVGAMNALITLNAVGRHIWELLAEDRSPDDIAAAVAARFAVDRDQALADVRAFLADLDRKMAPRTVTASAADYGSVVRDLLGRAAAVRQPAHGTFELTARCNLACGMCYVRTPASGRGPGLAPAPELAAPAWLDLARQAVDAGMVFLLLTGGEIFARHDFFEIYEPLTRLGLVLALYTNGTRVTRDVAARLAQAPPSRVEITLYGATAATAEAVTGVPGSHAACLRGIEALLERGLPLGLKTTLTRRNAGELEAMRGMAQAWGAPFSASWLLSRRPDGAPSAADDGRLPEDEGVELEAADLAAADEWSEQALKGPTAADRGNFYCRAGRAAFVIDASGAMNVCSLLPRPGARPLEAGFARAWDRVVRYVEDAPPAAAECRSCDAAAYCGRCPAWSLTETGTLTEPTPYLCRVARARKARYGPR